MPDGAPPELQTWWDGEATPDDDALDAARLALGSDAPELVFACAYEELVRPADRRQLGTYFTPPVVVDFMIGLLAEALPVPGSIVDAGAGVGALTLAARRRWPSAQVHAVDVNRASLGLLAVASGTAGRADAGALRLAVDDYLRWSVGWKRLPAPRALLANPPYTRHQGRTAEEKDAATDAAGRLVPHRTGSLSSYMLAATWWQLDKGDALCLVLPDNWLHAAYAAGLRAALWDCLDRRIDLYAMPDGKSVFEDARFRAMVLLVWPSADGTQPVTVHRTDHGADGLTAEPVTAASGRGRPAGDPLRELWRAGVAADGPRRPADPADGADEDRRPLSDLVLVRRGIATGSNRHFLLRDPDVAGVPPERLAKAVHRLAHVRGNVLDDAEHDRLRKEGKPCWLLKAPQPTDADPAVEALLQAARDADVDGRVLCVRRQVWCALEFPDHAPVLIVSPSVNGPGAFTVVRNDAQSYVTNNLLGVHARPGAPLTGRQWQRVAEWLRGDDAQAQWRRLARVHSGGLRKLEPKAAREVMVPSWLADELRQ